MGASPDSSKTDIPDQQVAGRFAANEQARGAEADGDDGRPSDQVVLGRHRMVVRTGAGHREQVTGPAIFQLTFGPEGSHKVQATMVF